MEHTFVAISSAGPNHHPSKSTREQPFRLRLDTTKGAIVIAVQPLFPSRHDDPISRATRFVAVTAGGYLGTGVCAAIAAVVGEGQEWLYVAPFFLVLGACQLALRSWPRRS